MCYSKNMTRHIIYNEKKCKKSPKKKNKTNNAMIYILLFEDEFFKI